VHGFAHLLAEAGRRKVGGFAMDQSPVQPGTSESRMRGECATRVRSALPFDGRSLALNVAAVASAKPARHLFVGRADAPAMPIWIKSNECASKARYTRVLLDWHASGSPSFVKPIYRCVVVHRGRQFKAMARSRRHKVRRLRGP